MSYCSRAPMLSRRAEHSPPEASPAAPLLRLSIARSRCNFVVTTWNPWSRLLPAPNPFYPGYWSSSILHGGAKQLLLKHSFCHVTSLQFPVTPKAYDLKAKPFIIGFKAFHRHTKSHLALFLSCSTPPGLLRGLHPKLSMPALTPSHGPSSACHTPLRPKAPC